MKAAIYPGDGQPIVIADLPDPRPAMGELLIRVHRCGICGTDLSMTRGGIWDYGRGVQIGHEYAGEVVDVGAGVDRFRAGDRVAVMPSIGCGQCTPCQEHGNPVLCGAKPGGAMRGFAEFAVVPAGAAVRLPETLSLADGALIEPLAVSLYGARFADIRPGDPVLVLGGGTVALYAIYWARRLGAGRIVSLGFCTAPDAIIPALASYKCVNLQFAVGYRMAEFLHIADQMDKGHVDPKAIISNAIALDQLPAMMATLRGTNEETKVHVRCG